ncbi:hypothetical protein [Motiliproteus sp. MSK22-1]|uniref:hypothetical protein n=1 Tax=Motiliproteus sp. MSK22-1 TaxID=1897630 RepID=UPI000975975A|nr:hypothetical protein [Motiliproteus sp. MSK22-1]OMH31666.1 hypothetical protein BGP75_16180 [Motiliproteus sp. MSK22-1]
MKYESDETTSSVDAVHFFLIVLGTVCLTPGVLAIYQPELLPRQLGTMSELVIDNSKLLIILGVVFFAINIIRSSLCKKLNK